jgi:hypothetical protein
LRDKIGYSEKGERRGKIIHKYALQARAHAAAEMILSRTRIDPIRKAGKGPRIAKVYA